jgi:8-oxo-dGTP diphosphatase
MPPAKPFRLAVKAVIFGEQNRCLLLRRSASNKHFVGCWEWPGGKVDPGEDFATATLRETAEEAGLQIELTGLAGATSFEMPAVNVVLLCTEARVISGAVRLSDEHDAFEWVPLAELGRFNLVPQVTDFVLAYSRRKTASV